MNDNNLNEMRVAVAKDVLWLMDNTKLLVTQGYGTLNHQSGYYKYISDLADKYDGNGKELQKAIPEIASQCAVCAKGAMILAHIHLYNGINYLPIASEANRRAENVLGETFSEDVEAAFEGWNHVVPEPADNWILVYPDAGKRLRAIMHHIIHFDGNFNIKDTTDYAIYPCNETL